MIAVIGASGNVGGSTSRALRRADAPVRAILRTPAGRSRLEELGCEIALADVQDEAALVAAISGADAVQVILPLRPQMQDPAADMLASIGCILGALGRARPERVLLVSDYGAHVGRDIGMPSVFRDFEERLRALDVRAIVLRSAEHMQNWARGFPAALASGVLPSFQDPVEAAQPMIASGDLGRISAELLLRPEGDGRPRIVHAEGPMRYSAADVAGALGTLSGRVVRAQAVPRDRWNAALARVPAGLADLLVKTNDAKNAGGLVDVEADVGEIRYGPTELIEALRPLMPPR